MKYVVHSSVAIKWYVSDTDTVKALRLRGDFQSGTHQLLAPDILPVEYAVALMAAEQQGLIPLTDTVLGLDDLDAVGIALLATKPLLPRAMTISKQIRLSIYTSLFVALAEREQCQLITANPKIIRKTRKQFSFIVPFSSLP